MSLICVAPVLTVPDHVAYDLGRAAAYLAAAAEKQAAAPAISYGLEGRLYLSNSGWLLMSVPNALGRGAFDALNEPGIELPTRNTDDANAVFNAHVTVMSPDELAEIGGADKITERGHAVPYTLGPIKSVDPTTWNGVSRVWYITVYSPELQKIRKSYGLPAKRNGHDLHCTFAIRRKGVLYDNEQTKGTTQSKAAGVTRQSPYTGVSDMAWDDRALRKSELSTVSGLRGSRYSGLPPVASQLLGILAGHGLKAAGYDDRATQQCSWVQSEQLSLEHSRGAGPQQTKQSVDHCERRDITASGMGVATGNQAEYDPLADQSGRLDTSRSSNSPASSLVKVALSVRDVQSAVKDVEPNPTEAQKAVGNYRKGHLVWQGLPLTIETAAGQTRSGTSKAGKKWSITLKDHYGYIKRTESEADGDHIDVFLSEDDLSSDIVFVVNQNVDGKFDEHKCVLGAKNEEQARDIYTRNYDKNWKGLDSITALTLDQFKAWIVDGDTSKPLRSAELKAAGSFYVNSLVNTPVAWNPQQGVVRNVVSHLSKVKAVGDRQINQAYGTERLFDALDPNRKLTRVADLLAGRRAPLVSHPVDRLLHGGS